MKTQSRIGLLSRRKPDAFGIETYDAQAFSCKMWLKIAASHSLDSYAIVRHNAPPGSRGSWRSFVLSVLLSFLCIGAGGIRTANNIGGGWRFVAVGACL